MREKQETKEEQQVRFVVNQQVLDNFLKEEGSYILSSEHPLLRSYKIKDSHGNVLYVKDGTNFSYVGPSRPASNHKKYEVSDYLCGI